LAKVHILMATFNGAKYLQDQLTSLMDQTHSDWCLHISDDGSSDGTAQLIQDFSAKNPARVLNCVTGPKQGSAQNFLSLLDTSSADNQWTAFADQDDVWMPEKLSRAIARLRPLGDEPAVYASRSILTKADLTPLGVSRRFARPFGLRNAVLQNTLAGNTIVMNPAMTTLVRQTLKPAQDHDVPFHDWWIYLIATACDARIIFDDEPTVYYRQHDKNVLGAGVLRRMDRLKSLLTKEYTNWVSRNLAALTDIDDILSDDARALLRGLEASQKIAPSQRSDPASLGLYRQTPFEDFVIKVLSLSGRI